VAYTIVRAGGTASMIPYILMHVVAALVSEDRQVEAVPAIVPPSRTWPWRRLLYCRQFWQKIQGYVSNIFLPLRQPILGLII
jgi:hypothetical protein